MRSTGAAAVGLAAAAALAGCGAGEAAPRWIELARGFEPRFEIAAGEPWVEPFTGGPPLVLTEGDGGWMLEATLPRAAWIPAGPPGVWMARRPLPRLDLVRDPAHQPELVAGERVFSFVPAPPAPGGEGRPFAREAFPPGSFTISGGNVVLVGGAEEEPPDGARLAELVDRGRSVDETWRVALGHLVADGIPVLSGQREEVVVDLPPGSTLRFATAGVGPHGPGGDPVGAVTFRVRLDGELLFEEALPIGGLARSRHHAVELPAGGRPGARLAFEVEGRAALTAFLTPVVGPTQIGGYGSRPFEVEHPDVVLFLADTFRADNLALHGGDPRVAPNLDRFAASCARFERAWSPSTWTLPSHASLFAALYPEQIGMGDRLSSLSGAAQTLAEGFAAAGYRTGAVTEQGWVSRAHGLDQGFDWFEEFPARHDRTLDAVGDFLAADDGRPFLLFVHSYRAHGPYLVGPAVRERLGIPPGLDVQQPPTPDQAPDAEVRRARADFERLYRGASAELDLVFEQVRADLERVGFFERGLFVFTSDHGEAFFEHGAFRHGTGVFEEHVHVPLLIRGPGIEPRAITDPASLVDLPRTLAALAGIRPQPSWSGRDLFAPSPDAPVFSFLCPGEQGPYPVALLEGQRKLIVLPAADGSVGHGTIRHAFDLARDPSEHDDLGGPGPVWPAQLLRRHAAAADRLLLPLLEADEVLLDASQEAMLRKLGYLGS